jgi:hypothetical protein
MVSLCIAAGTRPDPNVHADVVGVKVTISAGAVGALPALGIWQGGAEQGDGRIG